MYCFNNSATFSETNGVNAHLNKQFWEMSQESIKKFITEYLDKRSATSLDKTIQNLEQRQVVEDKVVMLHAQANEVQKKISELEEEKIILASFKTAMELNKEFEYWTTEHESVGTSVAPKKVTHCLKCGKTCHDDCPYDNSEKYKCFVFHKRTNYSFPREKENAGPCEGCRCLHSDHCNNGTVYKMVGKRVKVTKDDIKNKYVQAGSKKSEYEQVVSGKEEEIRIAKAQHTCIHNEIYEALKILCEISLTPNVYQTEAQYY